MPLAGELTEEQIQLIEDTLKENGARASEIIREHANLFGMYFIGHTGVDKSSVIVALAQVLNVKLEGKRLVLDHPIEHDLDLRTAGVSFRIVRNNLMIKFGGEYDTRGLHYEIINAAMKNFVLDQTTNPLAIMLIVDASQFERSSIDNLKDSIQLLKDTFPDFEQIKPALGVIISRADEKYEPNDYLEELRDSDIPIVQEFYQHFSQNLDKVFLFPKPKQAGPYEFPDREKILTFAEKHHVIKPQHKIALSTQHTLAMQNILKIKEGVICSQIGQIKDQISNILNGLTIKEDDSPDNIIEKLNSISKWSNALNGNQLLTTREELIEYINSKYDSDNPVLAEYEETDEEKFVAFIKKALPKEVYGENETIQRCIEEIFKDLKQQLQNSEKWSNMQITNILNVKKDFVYEELDNKRAKLITWIKSDKDESNLEEIESNLKHWIFAINKVQDQNLQHLNDLMTNLLDAFCEKVPEAKNSQYYSSLKSLSQEANDADQFIANAGKNKMLQFGEKDNLKIRQRIKKVLKELEEIATNRLTEVQKLLEMRKTTSYLEIIVERKYEIWQMSPFPIGDCYYYVSDRTIIKHRIGDSHDWIKHKTPQYKRDSKCDLPYKKYGKYHEEEIDKKVYNYYGHEI